MAFLAIDIGNTRLKWAFFESARPGSALISHGAEFLENIDKLADGPWQDQGAPDRMLGCCVAADAVKRRVEEQMEELWDVPAHWVVSSAAEAGLVKDLKVGRERLWQFDPTQLEEARRSLELIGQQWEQALGKLKAFVEQA